MESGKITEIIIPPLRNTTSLQIAPEEKEFSEIARRQLESLTKTGKKPQRKSSSFDTSSSNSPIPIQAKLLNEKLPEITVLSPPQKSNLSSSIVSKQEIESEIRNKVSKDLGTIEIPQEILLSDLETTPNKIGQDDAPQLHDQELIDILEGKHDEIELITEDGNKIIVQSETEIDSTSFQIIEEEGSIEETKAKILEREIAMQQIASLPVRKNKRSYLAPATPAAVWKSEREKQAKTLAESLVDDWAEEEVVFELVDVKSNETPIVEIVTVVKEDSPQKKLLNLDTPPKILNINASTTNTPASFKRARIVKKKEVFDPSANSKPKVLPVQLPPSITIKKVTKDTIAQKQEQVKTTTLKRTKKLSEIDKLLQDEGAVNMMYSLQRENNNKDVPEIEVRPDDESMIDKKEEKNSLITRTKAIRNAVLKQSTSPPEVTKTTGRVRAKRDVTPVKTPEEKKPAKVVKIAPSPTAAKKIKPDENWDFMYTQQAQTTCEDAMIIRRRSNSSYSSSAASPRRLSVDFDSPKKDAKFEFTKPPEKSMKSSTDAFFKKDFVEELRGKISNVIKGKEKTVQVQAKGRKRAAVEPPQPRSPAKRASRANGSEQKSFKVEKIGDSTQIILTQSSLSIELLNELKIILNQLESDDTNLVVVTTSIDGISGLNYSTLVQTTVDKKKQAASELVTAFK